MYSSLSGLKQTIPAEISKLSRLPRPIKLTALSLSLGVALIGALAMFFRKRRKRTQMIQRKLEAKVQQQQQRRLQGARPGSLPPLHHNNTPTSAQHPVGGGREGSTVSAGNRSVSGGSFRRLRSPHYSKLRTPNGGRSIVMLPHG